MSKEVVTNVRCDACALDGIVESGTEVRVVFVPQSARAIDLCERHLKELVEPLRTLVEEAGQPIVDGRARPATVKRRKTVVGDDGGYAPAVRVTGADYVVAPLEDGSGWPCPECDFVALSSGGLGAHRRRHGVDGSSPAIANYHAHAEEINARKRDRAKSKG